MTADDQASLLRRAAERAKSRPEYLACVLARFEVMEAVDDEQLRQRLGIEPGDWPRLQLCLRPRAGSFLDDLSQICGAFGIDRAGLAAVIRRVDAVEVLRENPQPGAAGSLLAARSRRKKKRRPGGGEPGNG